MSGRSVMTLATGVSLLGLMTIAALAVSPDEPQAKDRPNAKAQGGSGMPDLVGGLKATPGCLGVETAGTSSGKRVIFAWFENRKAALAWYNSRMHQAVMDAAGGPTRKPLVGIPEDVPILAIASLTPSDRPRVEGFDMPISQISIELYQPLPGGASFGGTFAPETLKIPGHERGKLAEDEKPEAPEKP